MNIFTKIIISTSLLASYAVEAQQNDQNIVNLPSTINSNYTFDGSWRIYNDEKTSSYRVTGTKLTNNSAKTSENLYLDLFLLPINESLDFSKLSNRINSNARLGKLEGKGTSFNNVIVNLDNNDIQKFDIKEFIPVLLLKERTTDNILNYKILSNSITITPKNEYVNTVTTKSDENNSTISEEKVTYFNESGNSLTTFDPYKTVESTLEIANVNKTVKLLGTWKVNVDFEKLSILIDGDNNSIQNENFKPTKDLRLLLYFSNQNIKNANVIDGFDMGSFDLSPIDSTSKIENLTFEQNILKLIPSGDYYPILVLKELNDKDQYVIKSVKAIGDKVTIY